MVGHISNNASKKRTASTIINMLQSPATQPEMFLKFQSIYGPSLLQDFQQGPKTLFLNGGELESGECCRKSNWI